MSWVAATRERVPVRARPRARAWTFSFAEGPARRGSRSGVGLFAAVWTSDPPRREDRGAARPFWAGGYRAGLDIRRESDTPKRWTLPVAGLDLSQPHRTFRESSWARRSSRGDG